MTHEIDTTRQLMSWTEDLKLKPASSIQHVCSRIFERDFEYGFASSTVRIDIEFLSPSYRKNPPMFAVSILKTHDCGFAYVVSALRGGYMEIVANNKRATKSIRSRVREGLGESERFSIAKKELPVSYRRQPSLLSRVLTEEMGIPICNRCKGDRVIWYVDKDQE